MNHREHSKWIPVLQSHIGLLSLLQATTHGCCMDTQVVRNLGEPIPILPIGREGTTAQDTP
jgi:hypothetical protein